MSKKGEAFNKVCLKCGETKRTDEFARRSGPKSNFRNICQECMKAYQRAYAQTDKMREYGRNRMRKYRADPALKAKERKTRTERNRQSPRYALNLAIHNAKKRHVVGITTDYLMELFEKQAGVCAISGIAMTWSRGKIEPTSMSIDKIEPERGYIEGNVRLVCYAVNMFRGRMTDAEMLDMARAIVANLEPLPPGLFSLVG